MVLSVVSDKEDVEEKEGKAIRSHFLYKNDQMYTALQMMQEMEG